MSRVRYVSVGVLLAALLGGGIFLLTKNHPAGEQETVSGSDKTKGPAGARIQIVEYSDFQCPSCRQAQPVLARFIADHPGEIRLAFRHFPLAGHPWSALAHQAAECANQSGRFWDYHDRLFAEQSRWSASASSPVETFLHYAADLGLDLDAFASCLTDARIGEKILQEKTRGDKIKITATPTFFINGKRLVGPQELQGKGREMIIENVRKK